jgi:hypothetical protein
MSHCFDASRSLTALEQDNTLIAVIRIRTRPEIRSGVANLPGLLRRAAPGPTRADRAAEQADYRT